MAWEEVGAAAVEALARTGIGTLVIVDHDQVAPSNLNRQLIALTSTLGRLKVEAAAERIKDINPECRVITYPIFYQKEHEAEIFAPADYVVDAIIRWRRNWTIEGCPGWDPDISPWEPKQA